MGKKILKYGMITLAAFLYAVGVGLFLDPNSLAPGGVTGISILLSHVVGLETGTWILLLNIPILAVGWWRFGTRFILSTIYCTILTSVFTNLLTPCGAVTEDLVLASLAGGALMAMGIGIVLKNGATTGGMDIVVKILRTKLPHLKTGSLFLCTDVCVVVLSALVFRNIEHALYAGVAVFITSIVLDLVLYGRDGAKLIYIISDHSEKIAKCLLEDLNIGVTFITGEGAYSGKEKQVILCVVRKNLSVKVEDIVKAQDAMAFMIVTSATEIYGEGYKNIMGERI